MEWENEARKFNAELANKINSKTRTKRMTEFESKRMERIAAFRSKRKERIMAFLSKRIKPIILAGLVLLGSAAFIKNAKATAADLTKAISELSDEELAKLLSLIEVIKQEEQISPGTVQSYNDPEVKLFDLEGLEAVDESFVKSPRTVFNDVRNDDQVRARAQEILENLLALGFTQNDFNLEEIINMLKLTNGQNPFDRPVELEDALSMSQRWIVIMNQEFLIPSKNIREQTGDSSNQYLFDYSLFVTDNSIGNRILRQVQHYRHGMIKNVNKPGFYPYANDMVKYTYYVYLVNGEGVYPSQYEVKYSGEALLTVTLGLETIELPVAYGKIISHEAQKDHRIGYGVKTETGYCYYDAYAIKEFIQTAKCETDDPEMHVNIPTMWLFGTINEANFDFGKDRQLIKAE